MKQVRTCTSPGCEQKHYAKGFCRRCYMASKGEEVKPGRPFTAPVVVVDVETREPWWDENATESEVRQIALGQMKTLLQMSTEELDIATRTRLISLAKDLDAGGTGEKFRKFEEVMSRVKGA